MPDLRRVIESVAAEYPETLSVANTSFVERVVAALRRADGPRWGFFRETSGDVATDAVGYYLGAGSPVDGSADVAIVVVRVADTPQWIPASQLGTWARSL